MGCRELNFSSCDVLADVRYQLERGRCKVFVLGRVFVNCFGRAPRYSKDGDALHASCIGVVTIGGKIEGLNGGHQMGGDMDVSLVGAEGNGLKPLSEYPGHHVCGPPFCIHFTVYWFWHEGIGVWHASACLEDLPLCCRELGVLVPVLGHQRLCGRRLEGHKIGVVGIQLG